MGYANKYFQTNGLDLHQVRPNNFQKPDENKDTVQAKYHVKDPIKILFNLIDTGQEFSIVGNSPFYGHQVEDMGIAQILATQEYTHAYHIWKSIEANERT